VSSPHLGRTWSASQLALAPHVGLPPGPCLAAPPGMLPRSLGRPCLHVGLAWQACKASRAPPPGRAALDLCSHCRRRSAARRARLVRCSALRLAATQRACWRLLRVNTQTCWVVRREEEMDITPLAWSGQTGLRDRQTGRRSESATTNERSLRRDPSEQAHVGLF
jgi:hypothetical protein